MPKTTPWGACTAQRHNGSFCDLPSVPDAPFPICVTHAGKLFAFLKDRVALTAKDQRTVADALFAEYLRAQEPYEPQPLAEPVWTVYYLRVGDRVKIGTSRNLEQRIRSYPPGSELLATEPGGFDVERKRCRQFTRYLVGGQEWFNPGPPLIEHINSLRDQPPAHCRIMLNL